MAEPRIEEDIDVQFSSGEPLFVGGIVQGRDTTEVSRDEMRIIRHEQPDVDEVIRINLTKANCWRVIRRVVQPEPEVTEGLREP